MEFRNSDFEVGVPLDSFDSFVRLVSRLYSLESRMLWSLLATVAEGVLNRLAAQKSANSAPLQQQPLSTLGQPLPHPSDAVYLDYQATTPVWPEVAKAATPYLTTHWGNPSSAHAFGRPCAAAVSHARAAVAALINAQPDEILFTACGSEADNHAIVGALELEEARRRAAPPSAASSPPPHVVISAIEHPAVDKCVAALEATGRLTATRVAVDAEGLVDAADVAAAVTERTILVSVMHSNNEVGSVQPIARIAAAARAACPGVLVHTDAAQSVGKVALDVAELGVDMLTVVGHKFGAPKGVAALYKRRGLRLPPLLHGGGQEAGLRAGTECVVLQVALGRAAEIALAELPQLREHMAATRDRLAELLTEGLGAENVRVNGPVRADERLPNTLSVGLRGVRAAELLAALSERVAASASAACHSGEAAHSVSSVLRAMGVPLEYAVGTLRLSTGRHTTMSEVERAAELILAEARRQLADASIDPNVQETQ